MPWYSYDPGATDISNPNNYGPPLLSPPSCSGLKIFLCAIQAIDNFGKPLLTLIQLFIEIANALNCRKESTNVKLRPTK